MKSYYDTLGIAKTANEDEIRKAFRKKALKFHPDRNKDNAKAEEKFKEVNEAYAVLKDKTKKQQYDKFGDERFHRKFSEEDIFRGFDVNDILRGFGFSGRGGGFPPGFEGRFDSRSEFTSPFENLSGQRGRGPRKGQNIMSELTVTFEEAALGTEKQFTIQRPKGNEDTSVKVPPGISNGKKLRLAGKGQPGTHGGPAGDLYFKIRVLPHPIFKREDKNILVDHTIKLTDALLGTTIQVPTLYGEKQVKVPMGTQPQTKLRLKALGVPAVNGKSKGDQFVRIQVTYPDKLSDEQKKLIEKIKESGL